MERVHLCDDPYRVVLPPGHRLARRGRGIALAELAEETWVGGGPASAWFRIVRHTCHAAGFDPHVALASDDYIAVQSFAAAGLGVAVIPGLAVTHPIPHVEVRTIRGITPVRRIWAARPPGPFRSPVTSTMIGILRITARRRAAEPPC